MQKSPKPWSTRLWRNICLTDSHTILNRCYCTTNIKMRYTHHQHTKKNASKTVIHNPTYLLTSVSHLIKMAIGNILSHYLWATKTLANNQRQTSKISKRLLKIIATTNLPRRRNLSKYSDNPGMATGANCGIPWPHHAGFLAPSYRQLKPLLAPLYLHSLHWWWSPKATMLYNRRLSSLPHIWKNAHPHTSTWFLLYRTEAIRESQPEKLNWQIMGLKRQI